MEKKKKEEDVKEKKKILDLYNEGKPMAEIKEKTTTPINKIIEIIDEFLKEKTKLEGM